MFDLDVAQDLENKERQRFLYDEEENDLVNMAKQLGDYKAVNDKLALDYEETRRENISYQARINELLRKLEDSEKALNDLGILYRSIKESSEEIIVEIPYSQIRNMFLFEEDPTSIFLSFDNKGHRNWIKSPFEMKMKGKKDG